MPRTPGWLSAHTSGTHLPSLLGGHGHASGTSTPSHPPPPQTPGTPGGVSFSANTFAEQDPLASYFPSSATGTPGASGTTTPDHAHFPSSVAAGSGLGTPSHLGPTASGASHSWVEIVLDTEHVILRGAGGDTNPARLSGRVLLHLVEQTSLKEVTLQLTGKAKVSFGEGSGSSTRSHHHTHVLIQHDWAFLNQSAVPPTPGGKKPHASSHALKAGIHSFPFSMTIEPDTTLPSSIRTWNNEAHVAYKLRATAVRTGAFSHNFIATKPVVLLRTFTAEALEFTQTLEIENTWPMKVSYSLTLPHKAFAAGDNIPIAIKFQPLMKGVHVTSISTVVKEYTLVHTRHSSHPDVRVAASIKHDIRNGKAYVHKEKTEKPLVRRPSQRERDEAEERAERAAALAAASPGGGATPGPLPTARSTFGPPWTAAPAGAEAEGYFPDFTNHGGPSSSRPDALSANNPRNSTSSESSQLAPDIFAGGLDPVTATHVEAQAAYLAAREEQREVELGDGEVDTMISIPLPMWATPTHNVHPVFVTHKIKWSCVISNPDGHTSELRCALPIHVLSHHLAEEARMASAHTRAVLFSLQGDAENDQQLELPSYSNHVYDRVANAGMLASTSGTTQASWSSRMHSPATTPPASRPGSRPASPTFGMRALPAADGLPADGLPVPERPRLNWADSELLMSIGATLPDASQGALSPHRTPPESRAGSRLGFRRSISRPGSRPGSRPSSPERERPPPGPASEMPPYAAAEERRGSLFNIPHFKPLTSLGHGHKQHHVKGLHSLSTFDGSGSGGASGASTPGGASGSGPHSGGSNSAGSSAMHSPVNSAGPSRNPSFDDMSALSQVPSYQVASRGFLGGGVVPLSATQGLPDYDESEQQVQRTQSEGNLLAAGRRASQSAGSGGGTAGGGLDMEELANGLAGLTTSASSSALASTVSSSAHAPGTLAADLPSQQASRHATTNGHESEDDDDEEEYLQIGGKSRVSRSPSVATVKPGRGGALAMSSNQ